MYCFTSEELYVLASILGREFLIGIEEMTLEKNRSNLQDLFRKNYNNLESRGLFEYKLDGTLMINHNIRRIFEILNKANAAIGVVTDFNGKLENIIYLSYGNKCCKILDLNSKYYIQMIDSFSYQSVLDSYEIVLPLSSVTSTYISLSDFVEVKNMYNSFCNSEADAMLFDLINDVDMVSLIRECILKQNGSFVIKEYKKHYSHLKTVNKLILRRINDRYLCFSMCDDQTVIINTYKKEN